MKWYISYNIFSWPSDKNLFVYLTMFILHLLPINTNDARTYLNMCSPIHSYKIFSYIHVSNRALLILQCIIFDMCKIHTYNKRFSQIVFSAIHLFIHIQCAPRRFEKDTQKISVFFLTTVLFGLVLVVVVLHMWLFQMHSYRVAYRIPLFNCKTCDL